MRDIDELNINVGGQAVDRPPPTLNQIKRFELHFKLNLPSSYIDLLSHSNGGHPELDSFIAVDYSHDEMLGVGHFYFLNNDMQNVQSIWRATSEWQKILNRKVVPFADLQGGDQLVLDYSDTDIEPKVCLYRHDRTFIRFIVAHSFSEFIDMLCIDPDMI